MELVLKILERCYRFIPKRALPVLLACIPLMIAIAVSYGRTRFAIGGASWVSFAPVSTEDDFAAAQGKLSTEIAQKDAQIAELQTLVESGIRLEQLPKEFHKGTKDESMAAILEGAKYFREETATLDDAVICLRKIAIAGQCINLAVDRDDNTIIQTKRIQCIQRVLSATGHYVGALDGDRSRTYSALVAYQRNKRVKADGVFGKTTWRVMQADPEIPQVITVAMRGD